MIHSHGQLPPVAGQGGKSGGQTPVKFRIRPQTQQGRARAGDKKRGAAARLCQFFRLVKAGDQRPAEGLVQLITQGHGNGLLIPGFQCLQQHSRAGDIVNGVEIGHLLGQNTSGQMGGELEIRDQRRAVQALMERVPGDIGPAVFHKGGHQTARLSGCPSMSLHTASSSSPDRGEP